MTRQNDPTDVPPSAAGAEEHIRTFRKCTLTADIAGMVQAVHDLHSQWDSLSSATQAEIRTLDAILLTFLRARVRAGSIPSEE